jgi:hypothetical protein
MRRPPRTHAGSGGKTGEVPATSARRPLPPEASGAGDMEPAQEAFVAANGRIGWALPEAARALAEDASGDAAVPRRRWARCRTSVHDVTFPPHRLLGVRHRQIVRQAPVQVGQGAVEQTRFPVSP